MLGGCLQPPRLRFPPGPWVGVNYDRVNVVRPVLVMACKYAGVMRPIVSSSAFSLPSKTRLSDWVDSRREGRSALGRSLNPSYFERLKRRGEALLCNRVEELSRRVDL